MKARSVSLANYLFDRVFPDTPKDDKRRLWAWAIVAFGLAVALVGAKIGKLSFDSDGIHWSLESATAGAAPLSSVYISSSSEFSCL
jgi:hypothetical protein